jgi:uncharacterized protein (TIGR02588 family)
MKRNAVEWAVLGISILAIVALVAVLVAQGLITARPPDPQVTLHEDEARQASTGWIIPADVYNAGDEAAEAVGLEASAMVAGAEETSEIEVNFLPAGTTVQIAFAFSEEPEGQVDVRLVGFRAP